jgi:hypothetical protein
MQDQQLITMKCISGPHAPSDPRYGGHKVTCILNGKNILSSILMQDQQLITMKCISGPHAPSDPRYGGHKVTCILNGKNILSSIPIKDQQLITTQSYFDYLTRGDPRYGAQKVPMHFKWQKYFIVDSDTGSTADHNEIHFRPPHHL